MSIWLVRAGKSGEFENKYLNEKKVYLTWDNLQIDLNSITSWQDLINDLETRYNINNKRTLGNWAGQIWAFANNIKIGDWVILPSKFRSTIHIGGIESEYVYDQKNQNPFYHYINVKWFATDVPRIVFDQDILYSLGAFMTVCQISRNNAEERIKQLYKNNWKPISSLGKTNNIDEVDSEEIIRELEDIANDQIAKYLTYKFKGHHMARLIEGILKAKGFVVYRSAEGPDKGVDLLAAPEPYGFGSPRICVQVKTGDAVVDRPTLDQLRGVMSNFHSDVGILASWSGFKSSVYKEKAAHFFTIKLWDQQEIINELLLNYDKLDEELRSEIPLKRIWTLTNTESLNI